MTTQPAEVRVRDREPGMSGIYRGRRTPRGGLVNWVEPAAEWRGTTNQVCGLFPFSVGGETPVVGVPWGRNLLTGETICCDPISWFRPARIIANPSMILFGLPGLGKSTAARRMVLGLAAGGVVPIIAGDLKPDYVELIRALGGTVVTFARGRGRLNPLDPGTLAAVARQLSGQARDQVLEEAHSRRVNMILGLVQLQRSPAPVAESELVVLDAAVRLLIERSSPTDPPPQLRDLWQLLEDAPEPLRAAALDRGDDAQYRAVTRPLQVSLTGLMTGYGGMFAGQTSDAVTLDTPGMVVDVSGLGVHDLSMTAAVLLATWNEVYGTVWATNALADAGLAPQRRTLIVLDELWRVLSAAPGMVDRINHLGRLNRNEGAGQLMITHSVKDFTLGSEADTAKAQGFVERAGMIAIGGVPRKELELLGAEVLGLSGKEIDEVSRWSTPQTLTGNERPPGQGHFLIKVGSLPGIPVKVELTAAEITANIHDTDRRWNSEATS